MSKIVAFGSATVETGKNKGQPSLLTFATGISPENSNGLPVSGGKVYVEVVKDVPTVIEFESADEVRAIAGENFDDFVLDAANAHMKTLVRNAITADARKLTLPPSNIADWVSSVCARITAETAFAPVVREKGQKAPRGVKAEVAGLAARASQMSQDELLAAINALAAKLG
jgi:hypothetical protein